MVYMMTNNDLISLLLTGTMMFSFSLLIYFVLVQVVSQAIAVLVQVVSQAIVALD